MFSLSQAAKAVKGQIAHMDKDMMISKVVIDSRKASKGALFVAIAGERFDGHDYVRQAFSLGASAAFMSHKLIEPAVPGKALVAVGDTIGALQKLAAFHREAMPNLVMAGVTGSNGKTTVKEMIASVFSRKYKTLKTEGNLNNHIGLPLTLLRLERKHEAAVVEMGINRADEMKILAGAARPTIGVITNIGKAHLEGLKTVAKVRKAKAKMLGHMPPGGVAVLNASDPNSAPIIKGRASGNTITFGLEGSGADCQLVKNELRKNLEGRRISIRHKGGVESFTVRFTGVSAGLNAAAAFAAGLAAGVPPQLIAKGLAMATPPAMRMAVTRLSGGATLLDDSYNANPGSLAAAMETLEEFPGSPKILVFGDMLELGKEAEKAHVQAAGLAYAAGVDHLFTFGTLAAVTARMARRLGLAVTERKSTGALAKAVAKNLTPGAVALVKASRGMGLDKVADILKETREGK